MDCSVTQHAYGGAQTVLRECLPNTGSDVWMFVAMGLAVILIGIAMRWAIRKEQA